MKLKRKILRGRDAFLIANAESPVVSGRIAGNEVYYTLDDGRTFALTRNQCKTMEKPRWKDIP